MTMAATTGTNAQSAPKALLRVALIVIALVATCGAVMDLPLAFHDFGHQEPLLVFAQRVTSAKLIVAPLIAATALVLAIIGHVRTAIATLAVLMLAAWISELPTTLLHGLELSFTGPGAFIFAERVALPLLGVVAIVLAIRNTHLVLAAVFVTIPMVLTAIGVTLFALGVAIYGF